MWARFVEVLIGLWLLASPLVFEHGAGSGSGIVDVSAGAAVIVFAMLSLRPPLARLHLLSVLAGLALLVNGRFLSHASPAAENEIFVGFLLLMFAIVPSHASDPPVPYRQTSTTPG